MIEMIVVQSELEDAQEKHRSIKVTLDNAYRSSSYQCRLYITYSLYWLHVTYNKETRELPGERDNARNNARCSHARKTTHGLDGQHQDVDRTPRGRVDQNDRGQR